MLQSPSRDVLWRSRVGRWSTTAIGRFYNGRDHSTVCYGIQRIESLRESDPDVDALISDLRRSLSGEDDSPIASAEQEPFSASKVLGEEDLARLAEIDCRACVCGPSEGNAGYVRLIRSKEADLRRRGYVLSLDRISQRLVSS